MQAAHARICSVFENEIIMKRRNTCRNPHRNARCRGRRSSHGVRMYVIAEIRSREICGEENRRISRNRRRLRAVFPEATIIIAYKQCISALPREAVVALLWPSHAYERRP